MKLSLQICCCSLAAAVYSMNTMAKTEAPTMTPTISPTVGPTSSPSGAPTLAPTVAPTMSAGSGSITLQVGTFALGDLIEDSTGMVVYLFVIDFGLASKCVDAQCVATWPPVISSDPQVAGGLDASLVQTFTRDDGTEQVAYNGHPLYYFFADSPGDTNGEGLDSFGGQWYVLDPNGDKVE